jgi:riboflavin-specific deaminase-like protein
MQRLFPDPAPIDENDLIQAYAAHRDRPTIRVNFVESLDGAVEVDGHSRGLSDEADQHVLGLLRAQADAVLVGAGTMRHEGYGPVKVRPSRQQMRRDQGLSEQPTLVVVSSALDLDPAERVFAEAPVRPVVLTHAGADPDRRAALAPVADVVVCGESVVDLAVAQAELTRRGLVAVLCEGGPHLFGALLAADLVDELCLTMSAKLTGPGSGRIVAGPVRAAPLDMRLVHLISAGETLLTRYARA